MAIKALSILIPTYNDLCVKLVDDLRQQAEQSGIVFEILVGDDGSTDAEVIEKNRKICKWPHCHYLIQIQNIGRGPLRLAALHRQRYEYGETRLPVEISCDGGGRCGGWWRFHRWRRSNSQRKSAFQIRESLGAGTYHRDTSETSLSGFSYRQFSHPS